MTAPTRLGRYEIVRRLGKSMTDVYLAIDTVENRKAALKLIKSGGDTVSQLVLEAERRGAAIQKELRDLDPRMVEIYDFGDLDGYFFVAMQYVEGRSLAEILQSERAIDPYRAATIALEVCEQLAKFHCWQSAVVHGDIKPSNIHLGPHDTVRLLDFGIAKTLRADCDATIHNFGSPGYCSPERLTRSEVDQQSDLWAVGATLYEMLAGFPLFQAENTRKLEDLIRSKLPPRALPSSCPLGLRAIVTKALAPNPARRYASAMEFQADLQAVLEHKPTLAEMERRPAWSANATLDAARAVLRKVTRTGIPKKAPLHVAGALAWFAGGMALWIGCSYGWQSLQAIRAAPPAVHTSGVAEEMPRLYLSAASRILESYRSSVDPALADFDWAKAELCFQRAVELGGGDDFSIGGLALSRGYAILERVDGALYSDATAARLRLNARDQFALAARKMPRDPAPHLALARVYVYALPDVERAMAEFDFAERLGATLGRREIEQQGDAYRIRAGQQDGQAALDDVHTARAFYQRVPGFDNANQHLRELDRTQEQITAKMRATQRRTAASRRRRWLWQ